MKKILIIGTIVVIAIVTYSFAIPQGEKKDKPEKGVVIQMNNDLYLKNVADYNNTKEWKFKGDKPVVIDFYADWCGPCRMVAPLMKELAKEYEDQIVIYKVNVDNESELATALGIKNLPTILFIPQKGDPQLIVGSADKSTFKRAIDQVLLGKPAK
nr:thioredoxin [uncultured Bacteroides sp.]